MTKNYIKRAKILYICNNMIYDKNFRIYQFEFFYEG